MVVTADRTQHDTLNELLAHPTLSDAHRDGDARAGLLGQLGLCRRLG